MIDELDIDPFIFAPLFRDRFKSFKRFLIYFFHKQNLIDLRTKLSSDYTNNDLLQITDLIFQQIEPKKKIPKHKLYKMLSIDDETFNDKFKSYLYLHGLENKRKFTLEEAFNLLLYNQGEGDWANSNFIGKKDLASKLYDGKPNYKKLRAELSKFLSEEELNMKKLPIRKVKEFADHIELSEEERESIFKFKERERYNYISFSIMYFFVRLKLHKINNNDVVSI